jgi:spermidine synthase
VNRDFPGSSGFFFIAGGEALKRLMNIIRITACFLNGGDHSEASLLDLVLFGIGSVSVLGQVILLREWMVAGYGVELVSIMALGAWMLLNAAGVFLAASKRGPNLSAALFLGSFGVLAGMVFIRSLRTLAGLPPGTYLPLFTFIPAVVASLFPLCLCLGAAFQRAADQGMRHGRTLAHAYAVECAGSVSGGLLSALLLHWGVQNTAQALVCAAITTVAALLAEERMPGRDRRPGGSAMKLLFAGIILIALMSGSDRLDRAVTRWNHPDLMESRDSAYGRLTVTRRKGQTVLYQNDVLIADSQSVSAEELVHLVGLQHTDPRQVLILEGSAEGLSGEAARHRPDQITLIEIDPVLLCLTRRYMPADFPGSGFQVKINTHIQDPRQYLRSDNAFDLIISGCPEPSTALANRFFTRTFFKWCEARLAPGGILGFRLNSSENFWSPALAYRNASVVAALGSVFRHVLVLPGSVNVVLASQSDLVTEPSILIARHLDRNLKTRLVIPPYLEYVLSGDRLAEIDRMLAAQAAPPNTDDRPVCYSLSTWIWLSRLMPGLAHQNVSEWIQAALRHGWIGVVFIILACGIGINRLAAGGGSLAYAAAGFAGFGGMVLESAMMLHYQTQRGALYQNMGILFTAFMLGMSAGAVATLKLISRFKGRSVSRSIDAMLFFLPAAICMWWAGIQRLSGAPNLIPMAALLGLAGFGVSAIFTRYAHESGHPRPLYAADVAGGGIGALVCGVFLFPLLGLSRTVLLLAGMSIAAGIGVALSGRRNS